MSAPKAVFRSAATTLKTPLRQHHIPYPSQFVRYAGSTAPGRGGGYGRLLGGLSIALTAGCAVWAYPILTTEPPKPQQAIIEYEQTRPEPANKEENRDLISSQHLQVKKSWENPGLYMWGSNSGKVAAPDCDDAFIKTPRRLACFDGLLLRDVKLDRNFGAALAENGDLVQWGVAFSTVDPKPVTTLRGKDLVKLAISRDRILALSRAGNVYSIPVSRSDQSLGTETKYSWWPSFWSSPTSVNCRALSIPSLSWGEKVTALESGLDHALLLTSRGRIFSLASSSTDFPSHGQLGIPGLTWAARPKNEPYDQPHEIPALKRFKISQIAAGDFHSLALDESGSVHVFGDNTSGQLGLEPTRDTPYITAPVPLSLNKLYADAGLKLKVTGVAAGGANSFFMVDVTRPVPLTGSIQNSPRVAPSTARDLGKIAADVFACGAGICGSLGNGKWTHVSLGPTKIKALSGLYEWNEDSASVTPIRLASFSVGSTHAAAVMDNVTYVNASSSSSSNNTNWGADIVWWGGNEQYQLGTGRRNNVATPIYIGPLDGGEADAMKGRKGEQHRFQITPRTTVLLSENGRSRKVSLEQRVECGRHVTAVYSST